MCLSAERKSIREDISLLLHLNNISPFYASCILVSFLLIFLFYPFKAFASLCVSLTLSKVSYVATQHQILRYISPLCDEYKCTYGSALAIQFILPLALLSLKSMLTLQSYTFLMLLLPPILSPSLFR